MRLLIVGFIVAAWVLVCWEAPAQKPEKLSNIIQARFYSGPTSLEVSAEQPMWKHAGTVKFQHDVNGDPLVDHETAVRAVWTSDALWLLFTCNYDKMTIGPEAQTAKETDKLWEVSDVAEAFIAPNPDDLAHYKEFQVSPAGQWVDLDINRETNNHDPSWNSGFRSAARVDAPRHVWHALMVIPLKAFGAPNPQPGTRWRLNFFRMEQGPPKRLIAWQPTHQRNFHVPAFFGWLEFKK